MKDRVGKLQRATRRALVAANGRAITTGDILRYAFLRLNRFQHWQYKDARRTAARFAILIGRATRGKGCQVVWWPRPELMQLIRGMRHPDPNC